MGDSLKQVLFIFARLIQLDEYDINVPAAMPPTRLLQRALSRLDGAEDEECKFIRTLLHWSYKSFPTLRKGVRQLLGTKLSSFGQSPNKLLRICPLLEVLGSVIKGFRTPLQSSHFCLFHEILLPLHSPNEMLRDQTPLIAPYHQGLVYCVSAFVEKEPALAVTAAQYLLSTWPPNSAGNSPKQVLLLHELDKVSQRLYCLLLSIVC
jgi:serine/threonine-protein phosphatase 2A regulatory subunit B'